MPSVRARYTIYKRPRAKGKPVYYFQAYDEQGRRLPGRSTGKISKSEARAYCDELLAAGRLTAGKAPTLRAWVKERHWFEWDRREEKPACLYSLGRLARSSPERPAIGRGHVDRSALFLRKYILPRFGDLRITAIRPSDLDSWLFELTAMGLSRKTSDNIASVFRVMLGEGFRLGIINENPWNRVRSFSPDSKIRGCLSIDEAIRLMNPATIGEIWRGNYLFYGMSLAAMLTSRRQGELLALKKTDVFPDHINVNFSWSSKYHTLGPTKNKIRASVAIPKYLFDFINDFAQWDGFIFSFDGGETPATGGRVADALYDALEKTGIKEAERKERGIVFHSWRKFANTYLRGRKVPDVQIRAQTGHLTPSMTDLYTDWNSNTFSEVGRELSALALALTDETARSELIK